MRTVERDQLADVDVGEAVAVGDDERSVEVAGDPLHPAAGHRGRAGVGEGDLPVDFAVIGEVLHVALRARDGW